MFKIVDDKLVVQLPKGLIEHLRETPPSSDAESELLTALVERLGEQVATLSKNQETLKESIDQLHADVAQLKLQRSPAGKVHGG